jgi:hypothetical protein
VSPPNQTGFPPEETDQEAHRVVDLSKGVRADVCWQGRQEILALIFSFEVPVDEELDEGFLLVDGDNVRSTSSHQSSSTAVVIPESATHFLRPFGTKNWTLR